jgi:hypothetical protein
VADVDPLDAALDAHDKQRAAVAQGQIDQTARREAWIGEYQEFAKELPAAFHPLIERLTGRGHRATLKDQRDQGTDRIVGKSEFEFRAAGALGVGSSYTMTLTPLPDTETVEVAQKVRAQRSQESFPLDQLKAANLVEQAQESIVSILSA